MTAVRNERVKLLATALNNLGVATVVTGLIAPLVSAFYGLTTPGPGSRWWVMAAIWTASGVVLHIFARWTLRQLED